MSDEIRELRNEIIALKEINRKLEEKNIELLKENETLKKDQAESTNVIATLELDEKQSNDLGEKPKSSAKCIPNWLFEVLAWINRIEMANSKLSTSSWTFKQLCWPKLHLNVKADGIYCLTFLLVRHELGNARTLLRHQCKDEFIPIASIPPPNYILGINRIEIKFMDDHLMNFIKCISNLLQNCKLDIYFKNSSNSLKNDKKRISLMHELMEFLADKIYKFTFDGPNLNLNDFNQIFPGILEQVYFLRFWAYILDNVQIDIILNWLAKPSSNGKQKIIQFGHPDKEFLNTFINRIKEEFSHSNSPTIFHIYSYPPEGLKEFEEFTLENTKTNEVLTKYRQRKGLKTCCLARYPKGIEEYWKEDGRNQIEKDLHFRFWQSTKITINI